MTETATITPPALLRPLFVLFGSGLLHDAIACELGELADVDEVNGLDPLGPVASAAALIVATDSWNTDDYHQARTESAAAELPWLPVRAELGQVVLGPLEVPGSPGCWRCAEHRREHARRDSAERRSLMRKYQTELAARPSTMLTVLAADTVAALVMKELALLDDRSDGAWRHRPALLVVDLESLVVSRHPFLPDPMCPECGGLPADVDDLAQITLASRPKPGPDVYRTRDVTSEFDQIMDTYVDPETGLTRAVISSADGGLVIAAAELRLRSRDTVESGFGRSRSYRGSELTALLEAMERYGGTEPGGKRTTVRASYAEIAERAIDPRTLGLHEPSSYELPGFHYRRFDEDEVCNWTWAYSFHRAEPVLVPKNYAYYGLDGLASEDAGFVYEVSNGCALGGCLEEAILYGILEVAERDAFLMTWYNRMPAPRIDLASSHDRTVPMQAAAITADTGYETVVFDTTLESGIPCVWAMAVNPADDGPKIVCAAGSHLTLERAILNALSELGPIVSDQIRIFPARSDMAHSMVHDQDLVRTMHDHALLYSAPEAFDRVAFLLDGQRRRDLSTSGEVADDSLRNADLRDDLLELIGRYIDSGLDVIVVDQTTSEHRAGGFSCVKVIIPGTIPMTFGHRHRRIDGLPRLYDVPVLLGYRAVPLSREELNPHPHPFP